MSFKNVGDYTISYHNRLIYDGTDNTASIDWKMERLTFENTSAGFNCNGGFAEEGIMNLMKTLSFLIVSLRIALKLEMLFGWDRLKIKKLRIMLLIILTGALAILMHQMDTIMVYFR